LNPNNELVEYGQEGYLESMLNALKLVHLSKNTPATFDFIVKLHKTATKDISFTRSIYILGSMGNYQTERFIPGLRTKDSTIGGFGFNIFKSTYTMEGIDEIKNKYKHLASVSYEFVDIDFDKEEPDRIYPKISDRQIIESEINKILDNYYKSDKTNKDIAKFAHEMNLLHPFDDGNIRTIVFY